MTNHLVHVFLIILNLTFVNLNAYAQKAEDWYLFTPDRINLYVYEFGKGDTVIVLHGGFGAEHSYLLDALKPLKNKFHFVLFDQRGSLRSPAPDSLLTFEKMLTDIKTIRNALHLTKVKILAHSMGTRIAMAYVEKYPEDVENLVLLSSVQPVSTNSELRNFATYYLQNREAVEQEKVKVNFPNDRKLWTKKMNTYDWRISFASVNIFDVSKWQDVKGGVAFFNQKTADIVYPTAPSDWDYIPTLKNIKFPITVINGDYDYSNFIAMSFHELLAFYAKKKSLPMEDVLKKNSQSGERFTLHPKWHDFETLLPELKVHIIKNAGHRSWMDNPAEFKRLVIKSLLRN